MRLFGTCTYVEADLKLSVGLIEPRMPWIGPVNQGDNVDALEIDPGVIPVVPSLYFSLDAPWPDPLTGIPHSASAAIHGFATEYRRLSNATAGRMDGGDGRRGGWRPRRFATGICGPSTVRSTR